MTAGCVLDWRVRPLVEQFLLRLEDVVPALLDRAYVTGSALTEDWQPSQADIDLVLVVRRRVTELDSEALTPLHASTKGRHPVDGVYLTASQLAAGPDEIADAPQVVDGDFGLAKPHGQLCWVSWVELSHSPIAKVSVDGVTWSPPEPPPFEDLGARAAAYSRENLVGYWSPLADRADAGLDGLSAEAEVPPETVTWLALGSARLLITMDTGRVVSKSAGARWAAERWPEFDGLIQKAIRSRQGVAETFTVAEARQSVALLRRCVEAGQTAS